MADQESGEWIPIPKGVRIRLDKNAGALFRGPSEDEAVALVEEALERGSFANGKPLGEKRDTLELWLKKIYQEREHDAKVQKIETKIDEVLKNQPKQHKLLLKPILRRCQYQQQGLSEDEE